tara:strand:+ start:33 stop:251 length:219 start_codon:yes stop_codon:yes gene_type:complete
VKRGDLVVISKHIDPVRQEYWRHYADKVGLYVGEYLPGGPISKPPWASVDFCGIKGSVLIPFYDLDVLNEAG